MPKLDKPGEGGGNKIGKGVFLSTVEIVKVEDKSNHPRYKDREITTTKKGDPADLWLEVTTREEGRDFERKQIFFGYYKTDKVTGRIKGWNTFNNGVYEFLYVMLGSHEAIEEFIQEDFSLPDKINTEFIGKKYQKVSFVSGTYQKDDEEKPSYRDWAKIFPVDTPEEEIQQIWEKASVNLKTYTPDVIDLFQKDDDTKFNYGANAPESQSKYGEEDVI